MKRFAPEQLRRFLEVVDGHLDQSAEITLIGGSALAIGYGVGRATNDIDTYESELRAVEHAAHLARATTGLQIPIANSTVAQVPAGAEDRRRRVLKSLTRLVVFVVDPHDLAASKLLRGNEHDRAQLAELHSLEPLFQDVLVARFADLLIDYVGDPTEPRWALVHFVEETWGELAGLEARRAMGLGRSTSR